MEAEPQTCTVTCSHVIRYFLYLPVFVAHTVSEGSVHIYFSACVCIERQFKHNT